MEQYFEFSQTNDLRFPSLSVPAMNRFEESLVVILNSSPRMESLPLDEIDCRDYPISAQSIATLAIEAGFSEAHVYRGIRDLVASGDLSIFLDFEPGSIPGRSDPYSTLSREMHTNGAVPFRRVWLVASSELRERVGPPEGWVTPIFPASGPLLAKFAHRLCRYAVETVLRWLRARDCQSQGAAVASRNGLSDRAVLRTLGWIDDCLQRSSLSPFAFMDEHAHRWTSQWVESIAGTLDQSTTRINEPNAIITNFGLSLRHYQSLSDCGFSSVERNALAHLYLPRLDRDVPTWPAEEEQACLASLDALSSADLGEVLKGLGAEFEAWERSLVPQSLEELGETALRLRTELQEQIRANPHVRWPDDTDIVPGRWGVQPVPKLGLLVQQALVLAPDSPLVLPVTNGEQRLSTLAVLNALITWHAQVTRALRPELDELSKPAGSSTATAAPSPRADAAESGAGGSKGNRRRRRGKGDRLSSKLLLMIAQFTQHHNYSDEKPLNRNPIGCRELARRAGVMPATASNFFARVFEGHEQYIHACRSDADHHVLIRELRRLNQEVTAYHASLDGKSDADDRRAARGGCSD